jgi:NADH-ubiquinone oxidoreductase chain 4
MVLISGRNNKNKSPGWLVSLVIGDYLAWFGEHLLGERFFCC